MLIDFSEKRTLYIGTIIVVVIMFLFLILRMQQAWEQMEFNLNERADGVLQRVSNSVSPTVWNIYKKSTDRFYSQTTASAILDSELNASFLIGINVYGNFGHLYMGRAKNTSGKIINFSSEYKQSLIEKEIQRKRLPITQGKMTIGHVEVFYNNTSYLSSLYRIYFFECLQFLFITFLILLSLNMLARASKAKKSVELTLSQLQNTQDKLIESEKLASLGALVAGVSHEINTPLGVVITMTSLAVEKNKDIKKKFDNNELTVLDMEEFLNDVGESMAISTKSLHRVTELLSSFKHVAADQVVGDEREINLIEYISEIMSTLSTELKKNKVNYHFNGETEVLITTVPGAFAQVLTNLVTNSIRHGFEHREQKNISVSVMSDDEEVVLIYEDDGNGMDSDVLKNIYEPFFTTKRNTGGIGLGMNIVFSNVKKKLKGDLIIDSKPGSGSCFTLTLPKTIHKD